LDFEEVEDDWISSELIEMICFFSFEEDELLIMDDWLVDWRLEGGLEKEITTGLD